MTEPTSIPQHIWESLATEAQAVLAGGIGHWERRIADRDERLNRNSTNSSPPPSSDPPGVQRRPPAPPSGQRRGGQPGPRRPTRPVVPPEPVHDVLHCQPAPRRGWGHDLAGEDPEPLLPPGAAIPPVPPLVPADRRPRLGGPRGRTATWGTRPPGVPTGAFGPGRHAVLSRRAGGSRLGPRPIPPIAHHRFGRSISGGRIAKRRRPTAAVLDRPVAELPAHGPPAEVVPSDEPSWREARAKAGLWGALTPRVTVFPRAPSRGGGLARPIRGAVARRVVLSDRFPSSGGIAGRPFWGAHLRPDCPALIDRGGEAATVGRRRREPSPKLFPWWHRGRDGTRARSTLS